MTRPRWIVATVAALVVMVTWTLGVKYVVPLLWFLSERLAGNAPETVPVMWDAWPIVHAALAGLLWSGHRRAWLAGVAVAAAEVAVVATKLALFLRAPEWGFWNLLWLTNKIYVLLVFACLLAALLGPGRRDLAGAAAGAG